jgi:diguanylate cyclase (GGDEF)-like protein
VLVRWTYALCSLGLIIAYPFLSVGGRAVAFRLVSLAALAVVVVGVRAIKGSSRLPWWVGLLLSGVIVVNVGSLVLLVPGAFATTSSAVLDAAGNLLLLGAALCLVVVNGRGDIGGVIDAGIIGLAIGGVLWVLVLLPEEENFGRPAALEVALFVVVFALAGTLGALIRLMHGAGWRSSALWLLMAALAFAVAANTAQAFAGDSWVFSSLLFIAAYTSIGLFGLDPSADRLMRPGTARRDDLSGGRLWFLGIAVAVVPVVIGASDLAGHRVDGMLAVVGGVLVTGLVMVRIRRLSAERDRSERALQHLATHDALTGLLNRREIVARLGDQLSQASRTVILFCDLDGFKAINDRLGHPAGDQLLVEVAKRLLACLRAPDNVARLGGDEFLILLDNAEPGHVDGVVDCISTALSRPIGLDGEWVRIGASIGLVDSSRDRDPEELIKRADLAMYRAKRSQPASRTVRMVTA